MELHQDKNQTKPIFSKSCKTTNIESNELCKPPYTIGVLPGEGIGPEIIDVTLNILNTVSNITNTPFIIKTGGDIGCPAKEKYGSALTAEVTDFCKDIYSKEGAVLCGPGGARFVYNLRTEFDLFCKFTPLQPFTELNDAGVLKAEAKQAVDIIAVRENVSGAYFGEWGLDQDNNAYHHIRYNKKDIVRIINTAIRLTLLRNKHLTLVIKKGGMPSISTLWYETFSELVTQHNIDSQILDIDHTAYQLIADAKSFDVIVSPNLFGDILADCGALLLGSRGMSYSGNFNSKGHAVFQTGHGAAYDLAGKNTANPIGQILSLCMMLRESFSLISIAADIEYAIRKTLFNGIRTADIAVPGCQIVGTDEMGQKIAEALQEKLASSAA